MLLIGDNSNNAPDRIVQWLSTPSDSMIIGYSQGYNINKRLSNGRDTLTDNGWQIFTTGKSYPRAMNDLVSDILPDTLYEFSCFRGYYFNPNDISNASSMIYYEDGEDIIVNIDFHKNVSFDMINIPYKYMNYNIEVIEKDSNVTIHNEYILSEGIICSVINDYGYAILRLYK